MNRWMCVAGVLTALAALGSAYVYVVCYDDLPAQVPTHWNIQGEPDGWTPKENTFTTFFLMPLVMAGMIGLAYLLPWLSPRQFDLDRFRDTYGYVMALVVDLFGYLHVVILWGSLHAEQSIIRWLVGGIFLFFALMGNVLGRVRRNFWVGVRTPWTLASEAVWIQTHRLSAWLFVAAGVGGFVAVLAGVPMEVCFFGLIGAALVPVVYSLVLYKRLEKQGKL